MTVKKNPFAILISFLLLLLCGCAASLQNGSERARVQGDTAARETQMNVLRTSVEKYRSLAVSYEKDQQFYKAAFLWLFVQQLVPEDRQARQKIAVLEERIRKGASRHLMRGKEHAGRKSYPSARNDFLVTLAYDPNCKDALEWLQQYTDHDGYILYETKPGDTARSVAQNVYADPEKEFVVAYFSGMKEAIFFKPQTTLKLPEIEPQWSQPEPRSRPVYRPASPPVTKKVYDKAGAEEHYRKGVAFFIAEDMQRAIREWEQTIRLDPEHPNARRDIEKARKLLRSGRTE